MPALWGRVEFIAENGGGPGVRLRKKGELSERLEKQAKGAPDRAASVGIH